MRADKTTLVCTGIVFVFLFGLTRHGSMQSRRGKKKTEPCRDENEGTHRSGEAGKEPA